MTLLEKIEAINKEQFEKRVLEIALPNKALSEETVACIKWMATQSSPVADYYWSQIIIDKVRDHLHEELRVFMLELK